MPEPRRDEAPVVLNPEAVGNPNLTPIVQLPPAMVAYFERTRCPECRLINHCHEADCPETPAQTHPLTPARGAQSAAQGLEVPVQGNEAAGPSDRRTAGQEGA